MSWQNSAWICLCHKKGLWDRSWDKYRSNSIYRDSFPRYLEISFLLKHSIKDLLIFCASISFFIFLKLFDYHCTPLLCVRMCGWGLFCMQNDCLVFGHSKSSPDLILRFWTNVGSSTKSAIRELKTNFYCRTKRANIASFPLLIYMHKLICLHEWCSFLSKKRTSMMLLSLWPIFCFYCLL